MERIKQCYKYKTTPACNQNAIVCGEDYRFTILTDSLIRMEYNKNGVFEDRATQTVVNRNFEVPEFSVCKKNGILKIKTKGLLLSYTGGEFTQNSLSVAFRGINGAFKKAWYFGDTSWNLGGTARTLDGVNEGCPLEDGIMSRRNMAVLDDSRSLILAEDGWVDVRDDNSVDVYIFGYRDRYFDALKAYYKLTGYTPLIPRYALGNWWSRYYKYTQEEYQNLINKFKENEIPFSVAVMDMDWHYTEIDSEYGSGWTGFSWNKDLFPNHRKFLDFLHNEGMEVTLNLHPAEGISSFEDNYKEAAQKLNIESGDTIEFDIADPKFVETYFENILSPLEKEGVSFWWMDWQQGNTSRIKGLDPLWMLNHFHYVHMSNSSKRPMVFSRYAGPGSHRYPIGFSGDTKMTWDALDFQPYFTVTASNIGYSWWSHDIGGHMCGYRDDELAARWVQLGVFSPIMRLHSSNNDFQSKEPWLYSKDSDISMCKFLRLRHKLIPYLYTMNYRTYKYGEPLIRPMYYHHPQYNESHFFNRNQYYFGTEMIVAPITRKSDRVTNLGSSKVFLPDGDWYDFFNGRKYSGNCCYKIYRTLDEMPVFVKAGGIVPMARLKTWNDTENPEKIDILIFPGADNSFEMYEDNGNDMEYEKNVCSKTAFSLTWGENVLFTISKPIGDTQCITRNREYIIHFKKAIAENIEVTENGKMIPFEVDSGCDELIIKIKNINDNVQICLNNVQIQKNETKKDILDLLLKAQCDNDLKEQIKYSYNVSSSDFCFASRLIACEMDKNLENALLEILMTNE